MNLLDKLAEFNNANMQLGGYNSKVLLIDGNNLYIRSYCASSTLGDEGNHVGGITGFMFSLAATIRMHHPSRVVVIFDGSGGSLRRRELFPDYKKDRHSTVRLNRTYEFTDTEEEKNKGWQLQVLVGMLKCLPLLTIAPDHIEADDAIAYLAKIVEERENGKAIILSMDKDFLQLVNENISVWSPIKKVMYRPDKVVEDYGFHPNNFLLYRAITGDKSDNIPGIDGIKEKTLIKHFPDLALSGAKDVGFIFEEAQRQAAEKKKAPVVLTTLLANREIIERNIKLMRLDEPMISGTSKMEVLKQFDMPLPKFDKMTLTKIINQHKFASAFTNWDNWLQTSFVPLNRFLLGEMK